MSGLDFADLQGNVLYGYSFPKARFVFLEIRDPENGRLFVKDALPHVTTGVRWEKPPESTLNLAFSYLGLAALELPAATLRSFPVEFSEGMRRRALVNGDDGASAPQRWDDVWQGPVHVCASVYGEDGAACSAREEWLRGLVGGRRGVRVVGHQDAGRLVVDGRRSDREHFGFADGLGNPDLQGVPGRSRPGRGKVGRRGRWEPLALGEFVLGYRDESGETAATSPVPAELGRNGTYMVYRKLHQNVGRFREYVREEGARYAGGPRKLAAKMVGRWQDGTPLALSPDAPSPALAADPDRLSDFRFAGDELGVKCPLGAHVRRTNPRDALGFDGKLANRRRLLRRGVPYGDWVPENERADDTAERGLLFIALNASLSRQFEFVQQQWVNYGNDFRQGNDADPITGTHADGARFVIQGEARPDNPPHVCRSLPRFVETRGGEYFFVPSITALRMIAGRFVDPR